jgi:DNA repair exonuclease SbcCD ATPase subunit
MRLVQWFAIAALAVWLPCVAAQAESAGDAAPPSSATSASSAAAPSPTEAAEAAILKISDRLLDEAERQHQVNQRMDTVIDRFIAIVIDLQSNSLIQQADGPGIDRLVKALKVLSTQHVPDAAKYLEEARKQLAVLKPNLVAADREIEIIIKELERLLASGGGAAEDLLRELEVIIQDEKRTHQNTKEWGAQLLQTPEAAERPRKEIAAAQDRLTTRTVRFMERLAQARDAETDLAVRPGMEKAHQVLEQNKVPKLLGGAARDVEEKKPVAAMKEQEDAIRFLEEAARLLRRNDQTSDLQAMKELRDRLERILKEQVELREKTEQVPQAEFEKQKNDLQAQERAIDKETAEAAQTVPPSASPEVKTHIDEADKNMQKAENQIAATQQQPATESQKEAEKALKEAIKTLDQDIARAEQAYEPMPSLADLAQKALDLAQKQEELKQETGKTQPQDLPKLTTPQNNLQKEAQALTEQLPMPQFQQAAQAMEQASQKLERSEQQPAMQEQQKAIDALKNAAEALQQAQTALDLASQQQALMQQTARTPQGELPRLVPPQQSLQQRTEAAKFTEAAGQMHEAAKDLEQGQGQEAQHDQQAAIDSLIGEAAHAMGMEAGMPEPGQGHEPGPPEPGTTPTLSLMPGLIPGLRAMPLMRSILPPKEIGIRDFGRGGAAGSQAATGTDHWNPFGQRDRDALYQKYARQLPPEYRDLLGDYYEALSKEGPRATPRRAPPAPAP